MSTTEHPPTAPVLGRLRSRTLSNGLGVVVVPDHTVPLVAVNVGYRVGARNEQPGQKGFAHLFEHLMFHGSHNVEPGEHSEILSRVGAFPNATTGFDATNYVETVPTHALELALWLEADRMGSMVERLDQWVFTNEREVVKQEKQQTCDSDPYWARNDVMWATMMGEGHPYSMLPIGRMEDLEATTLDTVRDFFTTHYGPNNAVLVMVGDLEADHGFELAEHYFGGLAANPRVPEQVPALGGRYAGPTVVPVEDPVPVATALHSFLIPSPGTRDHAALEVACALLTDGESCRLRERLVNSGRLLDAGASLSPLYGEDCSLFDVVGQPAEGTSVQEAADLLLAELVHLAAAAPSEDEMTRARASLERGFDAMLSDPAEVAGIIADYALFLPDTDPLDGRIAELLSVTAEEVRVAVASWLSRDYVFTVVFPNAFGDGDEETGDQ